MIALTEVSGHIFAYKNVCHCNVRYLHYTVTKRWRRIFGTKWNVCREIYSLPHFHGSTQLYPIHHDNGWMDESDRIHTACNGKINAQSHWFTNHTIMCFILVINTPTRLTDWLFWTDRVMGDRIVTSTRPVLCSRSHYFRRLLLFRGTYRWFSSTGWFRSFDFVLATGDEFVHMMAGTVFTVYFANLFPASACSFEFVRGVVCFGCSSNCTSSHGNCILNERNVEMWVYSWNKTNTIATSHI